MNRTRGPTVSMVNGAEVLDWDTIYRHGTPPWETGQPAAELVRVIKKRLIRPGVLPGKEVLELGCGTGADAICLARHGFDVTAVESSPLALERARLRAEQEDVLARFVLADVFEFAPTAGQFDLVYDAGFYHFIRQAELDRLLDLLWRVTRPGSLYLALIGSSEEMAAVLPGKWVPAEVTEDEIYNELGRLFDPVHVRPLKFASPHRKEGFLGWSCLMRRPVLAG